MRSLFYFLLVDGVAYLHSKGIVHRDLKPENILISRSNGDINHLKIADFGFARKCGEQNGALSRVVGTPGYMAPEIGLTNYSLGVDVWSWQTSHYNYTKNLYQMYKRRKISRRTRIHRNFVYERM